MNEVVAKRVVKKQQMQWSQPLGAHSLLLTRTAILNEELRDRFEDGYPDLRAEARGMLIMRSQSSWRRKTL